LMRGVSWPTVPPCPTRTTAHLLHCPRCAAAMKLVGSIPKLVYRFECTDCGEVETKEG
jgi:transposase-like protein